MSNPWQGEVDVTVDGQAYVLRLSLGALAELETALEAGSLIDLVQRFEGGRYTSLDVIAVLRAGFCGQTPPDFLHGNIEGGPMRAAQAAAQLLVRAFALPDA